MRAGYGRGYYGERQLAKDPPRRRGSGWIKLALVVGAGAVIWFFWPRKSWTEGESGVGSQDEGSGDEERQQAQQQAYQQVQRAYSQAQQVQRAYSQDQQIQHASRQTPAYQQAPQIQQVQQAHLSSPLSQLSSPSRQLPSPQGESLSAQEVFEDAVVESARQLQAAGTKVVLAPHLSHLSSRLES